MIALILIPVGCGYLAAFRCWQRKMELDLKRVD